MSNIQNGYSEFITFTLQSVSADYLVIEEPIGWNEDDLELDRHKDYHGIFTNFTNGLEFINDAKDYILRDYDINGINSKLVLTKEILTDNGTDVVWKTRYTAIADYETLEYEQTKLKIKFNSNNLAELIKSHESDEFELEREKSIDDVILDKLETGKVSIKGRDIIQIGESVLKKDFTTIFPFFGSPIGFISLFSGFNYTIPTEIVSQGSARHSGVDVVTIPPDTNIEKASNMFCVNTQTIVPNLTLNVKYDLEFEINANVRLEFRRYKWNSGGGIWVLQSTNIIGTYAPTNFQNFIVNGSIDFQNLAYDEGVLLAVVPISNVYIKVKKHTLIVSELTFYESSSNLDFIFTHDLISRLMYILTNRKNVFYSKYFGRKEIGYKQDGTGGLIGVMSGLWARAFNKDSNSYKSLTISLKDSLDSLKSVFNVGIGIENIGGRERLRIEDLKYFYQNKATIKLPFKISNVKRSVDKSLFFSGMSFGYEKAGDYEDSMGLDEPNTRTDYITPIRKSTNKFTKTSKLRTDEYGLELARRKPQISFPLEDTKYDEGNWLLDLRRTDDNLGYEQRNGLSDPPHSSDRLQELPSGVFSPETYRSMFFTPLRMMFRHAWVFRSGMEKYLNKEIQYANTVSNSKLKTFSKEDIIAYAENDNVLISNLQRSRFLPEIVEFTHPVDDDLIEWINGTTPTEINGEIEEVPNFYFKFQYLNENDEIEEGFLLNLKPNKEGVFKMQLVNNNIVQ